MLPTFKATGVANEDLRPRPKHNAQAFYDYLAQKKAEWEEKTKAFRQAYPLLRVGPCPVQSIPVADGLQAIYYRKAWKRIDSESDIQQRQTFCVVLERDTAVAAICFHETRNSLDFDLDMETYLLDCDDQSVTLNHHSEMCVEALHAFLPARSDTLLAKERLAEITELHITPDSRGRLVWVPALKQVLKKLFSTRKNCPVVAFKAYPLEYGGFFDSFGRGVDPDTDTEAARLLRKRSVYLLKRRTKALMKFYQQHLGFKVVDEYEGSMALQIS